MAAPLDKHPTKQADTPQLIPQKPMEDLSIEANSHPKELKKAPGVELTVTKRQDIEKSTNALKMTCKRIVDHICGCPFHPEDIIIGEASIDKEHFVKPNSITLQQQGLALINSIDALTNGASNLVPEQSPFPMEIKYKSAIVDALKEDIAKTKAPFEKVKTALFGDSMSVETTEQLLEDTVGLLRNTQNVMVQIDKLKAADTIDWQREEYKAQRKKEEEEARRVHEAEVLPLRAEKQVLDQFDGVITGFSQLPDKLHNAEKLTDPSLQELPKFIRHTKDGYDPDPLFSEDDAVWLCHPATAVGLLGMIGVRAIARKANTVKEPNPERPTQDKIDGGLKELSGQITSLKQQVEFVANYPNTRNPNVNWSTMQQIDALKKAVPQVMPILDELEDLPNKQGTWNLATIRASMLKAENSPELQQVIQACKELDTERKALDSQINPPAKSQRNYYDPYGNSPATNPNWPY